MDNKRIGIAPARVDFNDLEDLESVESSGDYQYSGLSDFTAKHCK